ncbi:MAG: DUF3604 domain-containing protein [Nevskia sp.]|nr:DUF3604 domain-containing protein [Nevskia sp.]
MKKVGFLAGAALALTGAAQAAGAAGVPANPLRDAYYGDLHLHTTYSFDAYLLLGTRVTPDQAYKFARGEPVPFLDHQARRKEPLDFLAVTDHSENIGVFNELDNPDSAFSKSELGRKIGTNRGFSVFKDIAAYIIGGKPLAGFDPKPITSSTWQKEIDAANGNYEPGKFTTLIAYEWTAMPQGLYNLHRNVFYRGDTAPAPYTSLDSNKPEDLWTYLESNRKNGDESLAIPHNANASGGLMYDWKDSYGKPIDQAYAERRALNEPLSEIGQNKGVSETHPSLSPNDEFANFEIFDRVLIGTQKSSVYGSYVRDAYGRGLILQNTVGVNPYKFGVVGATDFHSGLSTSSEDAYAGGIGGIDPTTDYPNAEAAKKALTRRPLGTPPDDKLGLETLDFGSGNITGVWAESNTRSSIYDALKRKETFATSGPRLKFRFFGGWDYSAALLNSPDWVKAAYAAGVPMGGDLPARPAAAKVPRFAIWALKDPNSANLDRVQVVKVWLAGGQYQEKVFDVALSGNRKADPKTGKVPAVGNTVDLGNASYANTIGATELRTVWRDPEFDPARPAVYYLRVLEIPTPRWSTILAVRNHLPLPADTPATIQERGWSSPIWYTPAKKS